MVTASLLTPVGRISRHSPEISWIHAMITQYIDFTRDFMKASRIHDYGQLKKIPCGNKRQARARVIHEFSGIGGIYE